LNFPDKIFDEKSYYKLIFFIFFGLVFEVCTFLLSILILIYLWSWCKWYDRWWAEKTLIIFLCLMIFLKKIGLVFTI